MRLSFNGSVSKTSQFDHHDDEEEEEEHRDHSKLKRFYLEVDTNSDGSIKDIELEMIDPKNPTDEAEVDLTCIQTFPWAYDVIHDATREDLVFVVYQGWLFGVTVVAILYESIPHLAAAFASESLATAWSMYKIARTESFKRDFQRIVTNGSCGGVNVLPRYFSTREPIEAVILTFNLLAFLGYGFLALKIYKVYAEKMSKRVEGRPDMERAYRAVLSFSTLVHLTAFFLITGSGLFIDQLFLGRITDVARHVVVYEAVFLILIFLTIPWLMFGLMSIRKESRWGMIAFFVVSLGFVVLWGIMFHSSIYRYMFFTWSFFATMSIFAFLLLISILGLSVYIFLNFGLGLPEYLQAPEVNHPADKVLWQITYDRKYSLDKPIDAVMYNNLPPTNNSQDSRYTLSPSPVSLDTSPEHGGDLEKGTSKPVLSIALPIKPNAVFTESPTSVRSLPFSAARASGTGKSPVGLAGTMSSRPIMLARKTSSGSLKSTSSSRSSSSEATFAPPGLPVRPAQQNRDSNNQGGNLVIPNATSRWSATTISTMPATATAMSTPVLPPLPLSGTGQISINDHERSRRSTMKSVGGMMQSRWSASTTTTTVTTTSNGSGSERLSSQEVPPVPELPRPLPVKPLPNPPAAPRNANVI